jgi:hypothetical protein
MKKLLIVLLVLISSSCSKKIIDVKSPCVSIGDGPCGPKIPINDWWLKNSKNNKIKS